MAVTRNIRSHPLIPSLQREVARLVVSAGFDRDDFEFLSVQRANAEYTTLVYKPNHAYQFIFKPGDKWSVEYSPCEFTATKGETVGAWQAAATRVEWWLGYLRRELDVGDPWAAYFESVESFNLGGDPDDNSEFTEVERDYIKRELADIKTYLLDRGLKADADRHAVMARLDYLDDGLARMGRRDWLWFALGLLMQLAFIGWVTPEGVRYVVEHWFSEGQRLLGA